jgi:hypothetical protein
MYSHHKSLYSRESPPFLENDLATIQRLKNHGSEFGYATLISYLKRDTSR